MRALPVRMRLTAWYALVLIVVLSGLWAFVVTRLRSDLTGEVDRDLSRVAMRVADAYRTEGPVEFAEATREFLSRSDGEVAGGQVLDTQGRLVTAAGASATQGRLLTPRRLSDALSTGRAVDSVQLANEQHLRFVATRVERAGRTYVVVVVDSLHGVDEAVGRVVTLLMSAGGLAGLLLALLGGWWIAGRGLRVVSAMSDRARQINLTDLAQRVPVPAAHDELRDLAMTLNAMLARLESGVEVRERLVADASHELRTPLAAMRAELDVSLRVDSLDSRQRAVLLSVRDEVVRMGRIVDNLLTLARADSGDLELDRARVDLHAIAAGVVDSYAAAARLKDVHLAVDGDPIPVDGDRDRLELLVRNLVDNAIRVAPRGGVVAVETGEDGGHAMLTVRDNGPGVPAHERERVFERFARVDPARARPGGAGLGLAICREITRAHGGQIWVDDHDGGAAFVVTLPGAW